MTKNNRLPRTFPVSSRPLKFKGLWLSVEELLNIDIFKGYIRENM